MKPVKVIVTGATSGLGRAMAEKFLKIGYEVHFHGRNPKSILALLKHQRSHFIRCDLRKIDDVQTLAALVRREDIRCFVNNAGIYTNRGEKTPTPLCLDLLTTNLVAPILILKDIYKHFKESGGGTIVNINSIAGLYPKFEEAVYCASKYGLRGFSDSLQMEAHKYKVRILDYYLGALQTSMTRGHEGFDTFIDPKDVAEKIVSDVTTARSFIAVRQELRKAPGLSIGTPLVRSADLGRNGGFEETFQKAQKI